MTISLYGWKPPSAGRDYLKEKEQREAIQRAAVAADQRLQVSRDWLATYLTNGSQSRFNWSGRFSIPPTITLENEDAKEVKALPAPQAQALEVDHGEGVGDAAVEIKNSEESGGGLGGGEEGSRFTREGHADFGECDTPF